MVERAAIQVLPPAAALGIRLREIRQKAKLSQAEAARRMGHGSAGYRSLVCRLEKGKVSRPGVALVTKYLTACGASLSDIEDLMP
ncbi:MAG: helix-turn-helix domain-containing protein, partial [candidate division WOR-3 bacterium]